MLEPSFMKIIMLIMQFVPFQTLILSWYSVLQCNSLFISNCIPLTSWNAFFAINLFPLWNSQPENSKNLSKKYYSKYLKIATWEHSYHHSCKLVQYNKSGSCSWILFWIIIGQKCCGIVLVLTKSTVPNN